MFRAKKWREWQSHVATPVVVNRFRHRGLTLVELLVVLMIIVIMMGVALPLMRTSVDENRVREGARQIQAFIAVAKAMAADTGRDCGIWIERSANDPNAAFEIYLAERPRPYAGEIMNAKATLIDSSVPPDGIADTALFEPGQVSSMTSVRPLVSVGDLIRFDFKGPYYQISAAPSVRQVQLASGSGTAPMIQVPLVRLDLTHPSPLPLTHPATYPVPRASSVPFQIIRAPQKSNARILQLTNGIAVDLQHSGIGYGRYTQFDLIRNKVTATPVAGSTITPVIIMFKPSGSVSEVFYWDCSDELSNASAPQVFRSVNATATISLLVGTVDGRAQVEESMEFPNPIAWTWNDNTQASYSKNLTSYSSNWVSIEPRNGTVTTGLNGFVLQPNAASPFLEETLRASREFAEKGQQSGGG